MLTKKLINVASFGLSVFLVKTVMYDLALFAWSPANWMINSDV